MATVEHFEDLEVWRRARRLTVKIHALAGQGAFAKDFAFRDQIFRAALSIVSNVAEGFERRSNRQFLQFLDIANGSAGELRAQLYVALDLGYVTPAQFQDAISDAVAIGKMLTSLIRHLRTHPRSSPPPPNSPTTQPPNYPTPQLPFPPCPTSNSTAGSSPPCSPWRASAGPSPSAPP